MPASPEKLNLASMDVAADKQRLLRQLFPEAFTETMDETGADRLALDFEKLKAVLGEHGALTEPGQERYGLDWPGKRDALRSVQAPSYGTLIPAPEESVDWENTQNVLIEGDNLEVLKLLQKSYYGKVKMIYIDPPYNTGNDFVYPDNYAESLDTYLRYTGQIDDQGFKTTTNSKDSGRFHSNWLRMMFPRLYVAKNLLREDGVIFISIDDNEQANLKKICDELFGEVNFLGDFVWKRKAGGGDDSGHIAIEHEYVLCYAKNEELVQLGRIEHESASMTAKYNKEENGIRYYLERLDKTSLTYSESMDFPIEAPDGTLIHPPQPDPENPTTSWRWSKKRVLEERTELTFLKDKKTYEWRVYTKTWEPTKGVTPRSLLVEKEHGRNRDGTIEIAELLGSKVFTNPKPTKMLQHLLSVSSVETGALVLDFFAGSGSFMHAVLRLNASDGARRRCISVQLPEPTDRNDYPSIPAITKERIRRAGSKIRADWEEKNTSREAAKARSEEKKSGDLFSESKTLRDFAPSRETLSSSSDPQSPIPDPLSLPPDTGFRVFKLAPSNFKRWDGEAAAVSKEALAQQLEASLDHIATGATEESILFEILLKAGYQLTCPMEKLELAGQTVYAIDGHSLFVCVADRINKELIDAVAEKHPVQFICLDRALQGSDSLKVNTLETFRAAQPEIQFRTV
jgi:adenine-specific DNA-methyltransferase